MKVIEHGNTHNNTSCPTCHCIIEYSKVDIKYVYRWICGVIQQCKVVICPECGKEIDV